MNHRTEGTRVAVIGAGAVGGYFGAMLARAGVPTVLIGRAAFVDAVRRAGLRIDSYQFQETVHPEVSTELTAARDAELVLFCVKTTDTAVASKELANVLKPDAIVVSMQNGVNNVEEIRAASGIEALAAVVYVAASVPAPGMVKHLGRGDLVIGPRNKKTERVAEIFADAQVPCVISGNMEGELWKKLVWNSALNAISALGRVTYGEIAASEDAKKVVEAVVYETLAVARAKGVEIPGLEDPASAIAGSFKIAEQMRGMRSSTAQDLARDKYTEIDSLNGFVARLGAKLRVITPVNHALYTLVKLYETGFVEKR